MTDEFKSLLSSSGKTTTSDDWDAVYEELPVVIALSTNELQAALDKLDSVWRLWIYSYLAQKSFCILIQNYYQSVVG